MPPTSTERTLVASPLRMGRTIVAPIQLQLSAADIVTVRYKTIKTATDQSLYVSYRLLDGDGKILDGLQTIPVVSDGLFHSATFALTDGFLLTLTVSSPVGSYIGDLWVQAYVSKLSQTNPSLTLPIDVIVLPLIQGFCNNTQRLAWPNSLFQQVSDDGWYPARYAVTNPAAGTNWGITVPSGVQWKLVSIAALFTTSAVAGNRLVDLFVSDPTITVFPWIGRRSPGIPASTNIRVTWSLGTTAQNALTSDSWNAEVPEDMVLFGAVDRVNSGCAGIDVGDTWTAIRLQVWEKIV